MTQWEAIDGCPHPGQKRVYIRARRSFSHKASRQWVPFGWWCPLCNRLERTADLAINYQPPTVALV